jgi:hypothetical protein
MNSPNFGIIDICLREEDMNNHSPKNRKATCLGILEIKITSDKGTITTDPNGKAVMGITGDYPIGKPIPGLVSEISGKPAYRVELDDIELSLSFDEMDRFFRHDLTNEEYKFLLKKYGMFHEIHEDFYMDGEAWQPIEIPDKTIRRVQSEENFALKQPTALINTKTVKKTNKK